ncbi:3-deoxy-manno-octulosonate cytidylyltransferase [Bacillus mycoides]|uniref:3-deoxy-manno-octulosonate cytidylyltransferase n=1 Tax=Bacillus mycoides TaxID=1405 RepID=UPI001C03497B|nr:3-deoxy-manno-octulosonate cytidylyltransferase [Bacillus mycoides]QWG73460.1 3-deoxy-manno-octulosonate cytidylyltransferase [Bacillus mycoides]QWH25757.1 3-deoxy-manno-octulosonate cytidylyltransferase [Bacillus mycoides]
MKVVAVIPARYGSTRFPGKPLAEIKGKPMIQRVYERVSLANLVDEVIIATDHESILNSVNMFGGKVIMTKADHESGSDRIAEVAEKVEGDIFINIQGDEPLIHPELIDKVIKESKNDTSSVITAMKKIEDEIEIDNPNIVKVVTASNNEALYFSRSPIPYNRGAEEIDLYKHLGIYCYPRPILTEFVKLSKSKLEKIEVLEQLRLLENGYSIKVVETAYEAVGVDTPEDIKKVERLMEEIVYG